MSMFGGENLPFNRHSDVLNAFASDRESLVRLVDELKRRGNTAFQQKSYDEADALYSKAIELNDRSSESLDNQHILLANRSATRASMGKWQQALVDADACITLAPTYAKGFFRRAQALSKLTRFRDARAALEQAQTLEPSNKSVATLLVQVDALSKQQRETPAAPSTAAATASTHKTVTRVAITNEASTAPAATANNTADKSDTDDDDERIAGAVRGYKKLADGRVTTFFNNELTAEAKQLIGDIAPKKVHDVNAVQIKNVDGGSAWNVGNTFEERDMTTWAKSQFASLFTGVATPTTGDASTAGVVAAGAVRDVTGDASIAVVRGAKRYIFDFAFTLACVLELENGERIDGDLKFLDVSSDADVRAFDVEAIVPTRYTSAGGKALHAALANAQSPFRQALEARLAQFVKEYHGF